MDNNTKHLRYAILVNGNGWLTGSTWRKPNPYFKLAKLYYRKGDAMNRGKRYCVHNGATFQIVDVECTALPII